MSGKTEETTETSFDKVEWKDYKLDTEKLPEEDNQSQESEESKKDEVTEVEKKGSEENSEKTEEEVAEQEKEEFNGYEIDEEKYAIEDLRQIIADHKNNKNWKATNTQAAQKNKEDSRKLKAIVDLFDNDDELKSYLEENHPELWNNYKSGKLFDDPFEEDRTTLEKKKKELVTQKSIISEAEEFALKHDITYSQARKVQAYGDKIYEDTEGRLNYTIDEAWERGDFSFKGNGKPKSKPKSDVPKVPDVIDKKQGIKKTSKTTKTPTSFDDPIDISDYKLHR